MEKVLDMLLKDDAIGVKERLKDKIADSFATKVKEIQIEVGKNLFKDKED